MSDNHGDESFQKFYELWVVDHNRNFKDLVSALDEFWRRNWDIDTAEQVVRPLINRVMNHYEEYYQVQNMWTRRDVFGMYSPTWINEFEFEWVLLWNKGWRPTRVFHLLLSKTGVQCEKYVPQLFDGPPIGDLSDFSPSQFIRINEIRTMTIREEKAINDKMAWLQETASDMTVGDKEQANLNLESKEQGFIEVLRRSDDLRLRTLKRLIDILTPIQSVQFLVVAAKLHAGGLQ